MTEEEKTETPEETAPVESPAEPKPADAEIGSLPETKPETVKDAKIDNLKVDNLKVEKQKKRILIELIILAVLLIGIGGYYAWGRWGDTALIKLGLKEAATTTTNTSTTTASDSTNTTTTATDETADWKTYTNTDFGYEVKYPTNWTLASGKNASEYGSNAISITSPDTAKIIADYRAANPHSMGITAADVAIVYFSSIADTYGGLGGAQPKTLSELINTQNYNYGPQEAVTLAGATGYGVISGGDSPSYQVILEKDHHLFEIKFFNHTSKSELSSDENALLRTFQFITATTADWKTYNFSLTKALLKYPTNITITAYPEDSQIYPTQNKWYSINKVGNNQDGFIAEYNLSEWLKGPNPEDGYVLNAELRSGLLNVMKEIYTSRGLGDSTKQKLGNYSLEFMTYANGDRIYVGYIESNDGKSRGVTMINTHGQDTGLTAEYKVALYNQEQNAVVAIQYTLKGKEIDDLRARYGDYQAANLQQIDESVHSDFANLIANTPRAQLSFGSKMDQIDIIAKSVAF